MLLGKDFVLATFLCAVVLLISAMSSSEVQVKSPILEYEWILDLIVLKY